ncbi:MAG: 7,8-didemethyl-8-hydroxy-5-deazariboflavin synthase subunit CofH [Candidatus Lokiarchaeota archaeon]|nr:7,8-didemethyl-8-hydroxy-5-deazariboflavin synthase subunit CofH [Candidatus Lokiarchaeota archaeon]
MTVSYQLIDQARSSVKKILLSALKGDEIPPNDALKLLKAKGNELLALQHVATEICSEKKKNMVSFVVNRNINFTNICNHGCKFCSFSVPRDSSEAYLLSIDEIEKKVLEALKFNCTEICVQGGINLEVDFEFYKNILKTIKKINSGIHIHAYSPEEVFHMSLLTGDSIESTLKELKKAGLGSMPGTAAEILVDEIRRIICPSKINTAQWIDVIKIAHEIDIPTTSTMMYGHIEDLNHIVEHLEILRNIQKETKGFTEFVPLVYMKENPILSKSVEHPLKHHDYIDDFRLYAVSRIFFNNYIENLQCSWVKLGPKLAQESLNYGVNDFSGTLMEENISKSAGAVHGEYLPPSQIIEIIKGAGKIPAQRDTLYNIISIY